MLVAVVACGTGERPTLGNRGTSDDTSWSAWQDGAAWSLTATNEAGGCLRVDVIGVDPGPLRIVRLRWRYAFGGGANEIRDAPHEVELGARLVKLDGIVATTTTTAHCYRTGAGHAGDPPGGICLDANGIFGVDGGWSPDSEPFVRSAPGSFCTTDARFSRP